MDSQAELQGVIERRSGLWSALRARGAVVAAGRAGAGAFHRPGDVPAEAARLAAQGCSAATLERLGAALEAWPDSGGCLLDAARAAALVARLGVSPAEALTRARVRYQGTDGVRGKAVPLAPGASPLAALVERGQFTPELAALLASAASASAPAGPAVLASDGREGLAGGAWSRAAAGALGRAGRKVLDLGVAPTPAVPLACAALGAPLGAALTASHNPADQNGIKFFLDGRKVLPEPEDYVQSARAFLSALEGPPAAAAPAPVERVDAGKLLAAAFRAGLDDADLAALRGAAFIVDAAGGAYSPWAAGLLAGLGLRGQVINADASGANINRDSGVACLEGRERVGAEETGPAVSLAAAVRQAAAADGPVFGVALDGDGDRGLLLLPAGAAGEVRVVDGDRMAYLIASLARRAPAAGGRLFAGTVESDLAVFEAVRRLGLETVMTPVGDKWLTARAELASRLLVGAESSGHVAWPVTVAAAGGGRATVTTGNGLLAGLRAAAAVLRLGLAPERAAEPYPPGLTATYHTYFVERDRFYRDGPAWKESRAAAEAAVRAAAEGGALPAGSRLGEEFFPDEPDLLYLAVEAPGGERLGAVFARSSGTENKAAAYARGRREFSAGLTAAARALRSALAGALRDDRLVEARALAELAAEVRRRGRLPLAEARRVAEAAGVAGEAAFAALLFAAGREGAIRRSGDAVLPG